MNKNPQFIKDKKVQFYLPLYNTETDTPYRKYPYTKTIYDSGGLWAYMRANSFKERYQAGYGSELLVKQCVINDNESINNHYKAVYDGIIYDVSLPDGYEDYVEDLKFILTESTDNETYSTTNDEFEAEPVEEGA